jgi:type II secretory pathway pseudopilin PulG
MIRLKAGINTSSLGFTIVEILIGLILVGILSAASTLSTKWIRDRAMFATYMADIRMIKIAAQRFEQDVGVFPPDVNRGIDPGLAAKYGWQAGAHSAKWETLDLSEWAGPYLSEWKRSPWGGLYDWDNYEPGYDYMGITGGAVYVTLKPTTWGEGDGLPKIDFEQMLEDRGIDQSNWKHCIAVRMGVYPEWNGLTGAH